MGEVLAFPGVSIKPVGSGFNGHKSLIVRREGRCFIVLMHPILSDRDKLVRETFSAVEVARSYARRIAAQYPDLYRQIVDETEGVA